jgi:outer membrane receptor for ferrienterochelin and colicins
MKNLILSLWAMLYTAVAIGQHTLKAIVKDSESKEALFGATALVQGTTIGSSTNENGRLEISNIPDGAQTIIFNYLGYESITINLVFPLASSQVIQILLTQNKGEALEDVIIRATRSKRSISKIPTRIEAISGEELEEKGNMKPGDIRMLLNESTGIQTQQTSATSYNSSIRIQGLDGKYTQILRDGYPLYSGFSGGLSLMQIAPLDLEQVEVIKGASSTLYGGGAIAGLVNLVSKRPKEERELSFMLNGTSALGLDASGFYSEQFEKVGTTVFASYNLGTPYDPADIGLTAIPKFTRYTFNPRLFIDLNDNSKIDIGFNSMLEDRMGGAIAYINGDLDENNAFFEKNNTLRLSSQFGLTHRRSETSQLSFKNNISYYDRSIEIPGFKFSGIQRSSFTEANYSTRTSSSEWILGVNLWTDSFTQDRENVLEVVDYSYVTTGVFVQNTWDATEHFSMEMGLRGDYQNEYGFFVLPRISTLYSVSPKLSMRLGAGLGYKTPSVFTEDAERIQFRNVLPIDVSQTKAEQSIGTNFDIDYKTALTEHLSFSMNTLFFYTQIKDPLVLTPLDNSSNGFYDFQQPDGYIDTKGIETNLKLAYDDLALFVGYTLADVNEHYNGIARSYPLVSTHRLNNVLMYEMEEKLKIGLEAYYFSPQQLNDGSEGREYWLFGFMAEKLWDNFSIFINFENFGDTRQTRFDSIFTGTISNPEFKDIFAPVDGFVVNGGIKIKL